MRLATDLRLVLRGLRRSPLFATIAVLSLAIGIGANTAIFTLLDQLLLRRLPIRNPHELVMLYQEGPHMGSNSGARMHSYPLYQDLQTRAEPLAEVLCRRIVPASIAVENETERARVELVSGNYFTMLGVRPALGRVFSSDQDDRLYNGHPVVVLSYGYWVRRFSRNPGVIGTTIRVNDYPMTIVGVSAAGFAGLDPAESPEVRVPILMKRAVMPEATFLQIDNRRARWVQVFGRLKSGYTIESAQPHLQLLFSQVRQYETTLPAAREWSKYDRDRFLSGRLMVTPAATGYSPLRNDVSTGLIVLTCMVVLVLLIACGNVANLLIARGFVRQRDIAVRLSLGSPRWRIVQQLLLESLVLSAMGGLLGLVLSIAMTKGLLALTPSPDTPLLLSPSPDARILAFTFAVTLVTGVVFGLLPALRGSRLDLWTTLRETAGSVAGAGGALFLRKGLVTSQVALSFLLLFGAGLFLRSLQNLKTTETGLALDNLMAFQVAPALSGYANDRSNAFYRTLLERLRALPGVTAVSTASVSLLSGDEWDSSVTVEGHTKTDGEDVQAFMNALSPGYFATMKIPMLAGRDFTDADSREQPVVAIVNRKFAEHYFPRTSAIGKRLGQGGGPNTKLTIEIIGVVEDSLYEGPREGVHRQVFMPRWGKNTATFYLRTRVASAVTADLLRREVRTLDPSVPVYNVKTVEDQLDETLLTDRLVALLAASFGVVAALLASVGLYGVIAFVVARREKELGIRLALGAAPAGVVWLVMREVLVLVGIGLAVGVPAALAGGRYIGAQLYGVQPYDAASGGWTLVVIAMVSILAGAVPARRASRINPILALRTE